MIGYTVKDLQKLKGESVKRTMESIAQSMKDGTLKRIAPAKPVPLTHKELPVDAIARLMGSFGPDNLVWHKLNKDFYPNRKPHEMLCEGYVFKYKWHKNKMYFVEVTKYCAD